MAVDAGPFIKGKISYNHKLCCDLAGLVQGICRSLGVKIRWGGNWDQGGNRSQIGTCRTWFIMKL